MEKGWVWYFWHNGEERLARFFWMSPYQISLASLYADVITLDVSENRDCYGMYISIFIVVEGENRSCDIAFCLSERQDVETFIWMFTHLKNILAQPPVVTQLMVIFSDRAQAIISAVAQCWLSVFHGYCL